MSKIDQVKVIPRALVIDERGWFLKVIDGHEANLPNHTGEIYLTSALPGHVRGNHYHRETSEWFTIVQGTALLILGDPVTGERREIRLSVGAPQTIFVPAGIGHAFINQADAEVPFLLIAYADRLYDPNDTVPMDLV